MYNDMLKFLGVLFLTIYSGVALPIIPRTNNGLQVRTFRIPVINGQGYVVRVQYSARPFTSSINSQRIEISPLRLAGSNKGESDKVVTESPSKVENTLESPQLVIDDSPPNEKEVEASIESLVSMITLINSLLEELTGDSFLKDNIIKENGLSVKQTKSSFSIDKDDNEIILTSESVSDPNEDNLQQVKQMLAILSDGELDIIKKLGTIFENNKMKNDQTVIDVENFSTAYDDNWLDEAGGKGNGGRVNNVDENGHSTDILITVDDLPMSIKQLPDAGLKQVDLTKDEDSKNLSPTGDSDDELVKLDPNNMIGQLPDSFIGKIPRLNFISIPKPLMF